MHRKTRVVGNGSFSERRERVEKGCRWSIS